MQVVAQYQNVIFVDLSAIVGDKPYQSKEGVLCTFDDGSTITFSKADETHPGDQGMEYIAEKVIGQIN